MDLNVAYGESSITNGPFIAVSSQRIKLSKSAAKEKMQVRENKSSCESLQKNETDLVERKPASKWQQQCQQEVQSYCKEV